MKHSAKAVLAVSMSALWFSLAMGEEVSSDVAKDAARGWINLREALGGRSQWQGRKVGAAARSGEREGRGEASRYEAQFHQRRARESAPDDLMDTVWQSR